MLKKLILTLAMSTVSALGFSQTVLEGVVTDSKTGEAMPFVNIAISGETIGTISDINGEFKLSVPENLTNRNLAFSSVGYSPKSIKISEITDSHFEIKLQPVDLKIEEVVITDKSEAGRKVLKNVLEKFENNYVNKDFAYSGTYKSIYKKGTVTRNSTYNFNAYDSEGYNRSEKSNAYAALNYKFSNITRDYKVNDFETGINTFDFTSTFDIMRYELNVMNSYNFSDFDFKIKSETSEQYVIEFTCNKPKLANSGALNTEKYSGTITVNKSDNAVTAADYTMTVKNFSPVALSLKNSPQNIATINCKLSYAKNNNKYTIQSIETEIDVKNNSEGDYKISDSIILNSVNYKIPGKIFGKVFYSR